MTRTTIVIAAVLAALVAVGDASARSGKRKAAAAPALPAACAEAAPQGFRTTSACKAKGANARFSWSVAADGNCQCAATDAGVSCSASGPATITVGAEGTWKTWYAGRDHGLSVQAAGPRDVRCTPVANTPAPAAT